MAIIARHSSAIRRGYFFFFFLVFLIRTDSLDAGAISIAEPITTEVRNKRSIAPGRDRYVTTIVVRAAAHSVARSIETRPPLGDLATFAPSILNNIYTRRTLTDDGDEVVEQPPRSEHASNFDRAINGKHELCLNAPLPPSVSSLLAFSLSRSDIDFLAQEISFWSMMMTYT